MGHRYVKFYEDWFEAFEGLDAADVRKLLSYIAGYAFHGTEPDCEAGTVASAIWRVTRPQIEVGEDE